MKKWLVAALLPLATYAYCEAIPAQTDSAQANVPVQPTQTGCCTLANGTLLDIELGEPISSKRQKRGDKFTLRLAAPVTLDGHTVLPAGTPGVGEIIHAAPSGGGGKPGELLLAARYLELDGRQIPLRGFRIGAAGTSRTNAAMGASIAIGPFAQFIHGREVEIPAGTHASAKLAADTVVAPHDAPTPTLEERPSE